jgi:hypothetical protein
MKHYTLMFYLAVLLRKPITQLIALHVDITLHYSAKKQYSVLNTKYPRNELMDSKILAVATIY